SGKSSSSAPGLLACESKTTVAPARHTDSAHTTCFQCAGKSSSTRKPGSASNSSTNRFVVFATQLSKTFPESSTRSPPPAYHVIRGRPGSAASIETKSATDRGVLMPLTLRPPEPARPQCGPLPPNAPPLTLG